MKRKIKLHIQKYIFYDILAVLLMIPIILFIGMYIKYKFTDNEVTHNGLGLKEIINSIYEVKPNFFDFDENGIAIVKIDDLVFPLTINNQKLPILKITAQTKEQDECVGYVIVKKLKDDNLEVDTSHICDMIDY